MAGHHMHTVFGAQLGALVGGAKISERHVTLDCSVAGLDSSFITSPEEL